MRLLKGTLLAFVCGRAACNSKPTTNADPWTKKTFVTFSDSVEIPGQILPPGTYVFNSLIPIRAAHRAGLDRRREGADCQQSWPFRRSALTRGHQHHHF